MPRPLGEQRAGQPARAGADLDHRGMVERPGGAGDAPGQVEIEDEILPEAAARRDAVAGDDLAQRRQRAGIGRCHEVRAQRFRRRAAIAAASFSAAIRLSGRARPVPAMSKAVP